MGADSGETAAEQILQQLKQLTVSELRMAMQAAMREQQIKKQQEEKKIARANDQGPTDIGTIDELEPSAPSLEKRAESGSASLAIEFESEQIRDEMLRDFESIGAKVAPIGSLGLAIQQDEASLEALNNLIEEHRVQNRWLVNQRNRELADTLSDEWVADDIASVQEEQLLQEDREDVQIIREDDAAAQAVEKVDVVDHASAAGMEPQIGPDGMCMLEPTIRNVVAAQTSQAALEGVLEAPNHKQLGAR